MFKITYVRKTYYIRKMGGSPDQNLKDRPPVLRINPAIPWFQAQEIIVYVIYPLIR